MSTEYEPFGYSIEHYFEEQGYIARPRINFLDIASEYVKKCLDQERVLPLMLQDKRTLNRLVYEEYKKDEDMFEGFGLELSKTGRRNQLEPRFLEIEYSLNLLYFLLKHPFLGRPYYQISAEVKDISDSIDDDVKLVAQKIALNMYEKLLCNQNGEKGKSSPVLSI